MNEDNLSEYSKIDYFKWVKAIAILVVAFSVASYAGTYSKSIQPSSFRSFSVSGEGKVVAIPDVAEFSFTVITEGGSDLVKTQAENTAKINAAIKFVKSEGVKDADIKTQNYNISPRYQNYQCDYLRPLPLGVESGAAISPEYYSRPCPPAEIVGYTISQAVLVKARDFDKIGALLVGVVENGANSVYGPNFTIDDPTEIENEARAKAIGNARIKALSIVKAGGFRLGRVLAISEGGYYPPYYQRFAENAIADGKGGGIASAPAIEPGSQDVVVNVSITYEIR